MLKQAAALLLTLTASFAVAQEDLSKLKWETNMADPPIGDPVNAKRGGTFIGNIDAFPLTFRLFGLNSNDSFAGWNRQFAHEIFSVTIIHPTTGNFIPILATEWAIAPDNQAVYYRLDPRAKWSDGQPITADDFVYSRTFLTSDHVNAPFYKSYFADIVKNIEKVDTDVIKVSGYRPSWRPLYDLPAFPVPQHAIKLDENWIKNDNYKPPVVAGPYTISGYKEGESVEFSRLATWWGDEHHYLNGMYNPDKIQLKVISDNDRAFDYFQKGDLSFYTVSTARIWATQMNFDALKKGYAHRRLQYTQTPEGPYGLVMNLKEPIFKDKNFRKAIQYFFDFETLNNQLMYGAYFRQTSVFQGTKYENKSIKPYPFDPKQGVQFLKVAGFDKRGSDGIRVREDGTRASFTLVHGSKGLEPHLTTVQQMFKKAGIEMNLKLMEPATAFKMGQDKTYEMSLFNRTAGFYPDPHQYFASEFVDKTDNNNVWGFGDPEVDKLIDIYRYDMDEAKRLEAAAAIDARIHDEAFIVHFWTAPMIRYAYWDDVQFPETYFPRMTNQYMDYQVFWIDQDRKKALDAAVAAGKPLGPEDPVVEVDPYGIKKALLEKK